MRRTSTIYIFLLFSIAANAQGKNDYVWCLGYGVNPANHGGGTRIDFNGSEPELTHFAFPYHFGLDMPCSISDDAGNLQFYSNGCQIVNYENKVMENGDDLSPGYFQSIECDNYPYGYDSYQNMLILPRPGHPGRYVYFPHTAEMDIESGKVLYSEVDMNTNNGTGKVILKNQILRGPVKAEAVFTSVKHANGRDWWIIIPQEFVNIYNVYLLTPDTIEGPFSQDFEDSEASQYNKRGWNVVMSPDGNHFFRVTLTWLDQVNRFNQIFKYDFDRCTGTLSNPKKIIKFTDPGAYASWAAISPNSRFLYFQMAQNKLYQYDLQAPDIEASGQLIAEYDNFVTPQGFSCAFHAMALAPNNKIYMCTTSGIYYYHTIHAPDKPGLTCDFRQHDLELPTVTQNLMPLYPNFRLGPVDGSVCDTLGIDNIAEANFRWEIQDTLSPLQVAFTDLSYFEPATWLWNFDDPDAGLANMSQDTSPTHQFTAPGLYTVCLTVCNSNACDTLCREVNVNTSSMVSVEVGEEKVRIWPNPASDLLKIQAEDIIEGVQIFDAYGREVWRQTEVNQSLLSVSTDRLLPGLYVLALHFKGKVVTLKFITN